MIDEVRLCKDENYQTETPVVIPQSDPKNKQSIEFRVLLCQSISLLGKGNAKC